MADEISATCEWKPSNLDDYEYCVINVNGDWEKSRLNCLEHGGFLAYKGFDNATFYRKLYDEFISKESDEIMYFGAFKDPQANNTIHGLDKVPFKELSFIAGEPNSPSSTCLIIKLSGWADQLCTKKKDYALCQRPKGT